MLLFTLEGHLANVTAVQFSPDGSKLASASDNGTLMVWDVGTGARLHTLDGSFTTFATLQFSPDGSKLAAASEYGKVTVWNVSTGRLDHALDGYLANMVTTIQRSPDGRKPASEHLGRSTRRLSTSSKSSATCIEETKAESLKPRRRTDGRLKDTKSLGVTMQRT